MRGGKSFIEDFLAKSWGGSYQVLPPQTNARMAELVDALD